MYIVINDMVDEPLYMQIRSQIIAGIARGDLTAGDALPSVRRMASDLGINLHTVNKAYAVLRDEGYIVVKGRAGAFIAGAQDANSSNGAADSQMDDALHDLAMAWRARGGTLEGFLERAAVQANCAYGLKRIDAEDAGAENHPICGD